MRWTILAPAVSLAALLAAPASAALSDFRLPEPSTSQPEPDGSPYAVINPAGTYEDRLGANNYMAIC